MTKIEDLCNAALRCSVLLRELEAYDSISEVKEMERVLRTSALAVQSELLVWSVPGYHPQTTTLTDLDLRLRCLELALNQGRALTEARMYYDFLKGKEK